MKSKSIVSLDCETTGLELRHGCRPFMVTAMNDSGDTWVWEWKVDTSTRLPIVPSREIREINKVIKSHDETVFHNAKFDWLALSLVGVDVQWMIRQHNWHDTHLASHVLESKGSHGLKDLAVLYLDIRDHDEKELRKRIAQARAHAKKHHPDWNTGPDVDHGYWMPKAVWPEDTTCRVYAIKDVERTILLWHLFRDALDEENLRSQYDRERRLMPVVFRMEQRGISVLNERLSSEHKKYTIRANRHEKAVVAQAAAMGWPEFNIRSHVQVKDFFNLYLNYPIENTQAETLEQLYTKLDDQGKPHPAANFLWHIIENRKNLTASKYLANYNELKLVGEDGVYRLHPSMNQVGTATTRFSHSNPNSANVGKGEDEEKMAKLDEEADFKLRQVFGPAEYKPITTSRNGRVWYPIDYQQLQLRIFAYKANDKAMIRAFEKGYNFHNFIASCIFKCEPEEVTKHQKRIGKNVNFGFIFGASPKRIEHTAGMTGLWDTIVGLFPKANEFMQKNIKLARKQGFIHTPGGYRLTVPRDKAYIATNYYVQGAEGEIVKNAMIELDAYCKDFSRRYSQNHPPQEAYMTAQIHDELVFDTPQFSPRHELDFITGVTTIMERGGSALGIVTPVSVSRTFTNWHDAEEITLDQLRSALPQPA